MYSLIFLAFSSLLLSLRLTPMCKMLALRFSVLDSPDGRRKLHATPIPRLGGVAIFAAVLGAYGLLLLARFSSGHIIWQDMPLVERILPSLLIVFSTGLADDVFDLGPLVKLGAEIVAAIMAWAVGINVRGFEGHAFSAPVSFILTIGWIVGCTNAINLIDGVDGLAAGVSFFSALTMTIAALLDHNYAMALIVVPLMGALLGFLRYNFNPATIFLGDCGSLPLGFLLACCGAVWSEKATTLLGMTAPLLALAIPLLDTGLAVVRRLINNQRIFGADHAHIHHRLLSRGLKPRDVVLVIYTACAVATVGSLLLSAHHNPYRGAVIFVVAVSAWMGIQYLGYREFDVVRRVVLNGTFRGVLSSHVALDAFEREMEQEERLQQCAEILSLNYSRFGFTGVSLKLNGVLHEHGETTGWQIRVTFTGHGYINFWRAPGSTVETPSATKFIDCVSHIVSRKLKIQSNAEVGQRQVTAEALPAAVAFK